MTEAEVLEQIKQKKATLEQYKASPADAAKVKTLEDEIKQLESTLAGNAQPRRPRRTAFLDECAG